MASSTSAKGHAKQFQAFEQLLTIQTSQFGVARIDALGADGIASLDPVAWGHSLSHQNHCLTQVAGCAAGAVFVSKLACSMPWWAPRSWTWEHRIHAVLDCRNSVIIGQRSARRWEIRVCKDNHAMQSQARTNRSISASLMAEPLVHKSQHQNSAWDWLW